jgi:hypothetical protein
MRGVPDSVADSFFVDPAFQPLMREIGLDAEAVFHDPRIKPWRVLEDRENCTLDETRGDGSSVRLHIKRYPIPEPAATEVAGYRLLADAGIPAASIVAHGRLADGRSFVILPDLSGYTPGDVLVDDQGVPFETILEPTADVAGRLHAAGLHHRDLYLCHFMVKLDDGDGVDVRLIDTARVARLTNPLTRRRWIVKDLAQFWYSTTKLPVTEEQRERWLARYAERAETSPARLRGAIERKSNAIAAHDLRLNRKQPRRNISLPG